jgi:hypothetical protein
LVQGQIRISSPPNGLKQRGKNVCQLTPLMQITGHRLQIRVGILNALEPIAFKNCFNLSRLQPGR